MKKTNFNESVERFKERIKTDKKFKTEFTTIMVASVVVIATAITVPTVIHNNKIKVEENTVAPIIVQGENEIESLTEETESTANEESQPASEVSETENTETKKPTEKKAQESKKNSSNTKPKQETVTTSPQNVEITEGSWTQAEIDSLVAEIKAYAQSRGFTINPNLTTKGTSWSNPVHSGEVKEKTKSDLTYQVDFVYNLAVGQVGHFPEGAELNVIAEIDPVWSAAAEEICWAIYVVY